MKKPARLRLYVWEGVLTDYTSGVMFALASSPARAREAISYGYAARKKKVPWGPGGARSTRTWTVSRRSSRERRVSTVGEEAEAMKYTYNSYHGGGTHQAKLPYAGAKHLVVAGALCANADCDAGESPEKVLTVAGVKGTFAREHDSVSCEVGCLACGKTIGEVIAKGSTIFGLEEDAAVAQRCRVY